MWEIYKSNCTERFSIFCRWAILKYIKNVIAIGILCNKKKEIMNENLQYNSNKEMSHLMENISIFIIQNFSIKETFILSKNF